VDFTARWCLICQANHLVLERDEVQKAFAKHNVILLTADCTQRQTELLDELHELGREGVPANVLFRPDGTKILLPELLTSDSILQLLDSAQAANS
jgi:thiol:disulfide interchange protein DsbD